MVLNKKKIFLISTEPSGDLLGYDLIKQIYKRFKNIEIIGVGILFPIFDVFTKLEDSKFYNYFNNPFNAIKHYFSDIFHKEFLQWST